MKHHSKIVGYYCDRDPDGVMFVLESKITGEEVRHLTLVLLLIINRLS